MNTTNCIVRTLTAVTLLWSAQAFAQDSPTNGPSTATAPTTEAPVSPADQADTEGPACHADQLSVFPGPRPEREASSGLPLYHFGDYLRLRAVGGCVDQILSLYRISGDALADNTSQSSLGLVFNGVRMMRLPTTITRMEEGRALELAFLLARDSENQDSRDTWNTFLGTARMHAVTGRELLVELGLVIGKDPVRLIGNDKTIAFLGTALWKIWLAIGLGMAIVLFALYWAIRHPSLLRDHPKGTYSLAKSQMAFWAILLAVSFATLYVLLNDMERIPDSMLILVGLSGATSFASVWITPKSDKPTENGGSVSFLQDICSDGTGASVHRVQAVIWTAILGGVYVHQVATVISMPDFNATLLSLLGISNGTYVAMKMKE